MELSKAKQLSRFKPISNLDTGTHMKDIVFRRRAIYVILIEHMGLHLLETCQNLIVHVTLQISLILVIYNESYLKLR